jgi:predicted esterase
MDPFERNVIVTLLVTAGVAGGGGVWLLTRPHPGDADAAPVSADVVDGEPADPVADWCAPGFTGMPGGCLAIPKGDHAESLIVYLHGRYAKDAAGDEVDRQRRLAARATGKGFAVLALRGRLGQCSAPELATWYCWPSNETNADDGPEFVGAWSRVLAASQDRVGARRRYVLGFSNGGYFAGLIASRGLLDADAFVVAHGGPVEPVSPLHGKPPMLLLSADDDVAQDEMIRFDQELARAGWSHDSYARGGAHGLGDDDIEAALIFFTRAKEALPLQPPLSLHRPTHHDHSGNDGAIQADTTRDVGGATGESLPVAAGKATEPPTAGTSATVSTFAPSEDE